MNLEVGMYVRTDLGISRINTIRKETIGTFVGTDNRKGNIHYGNEFIGYLIVDKTKEDKQWIKDHIKDNIIDLIEVGDYVNGHRVYDVIHDVNSYVILEDVGCYVDTSEIIDEEDIKTIVTKEVMETMSYTVGD